MSRDPTIEKGVEKMVKILIAGLAVAVLWVVLDLTFYGDGTVVRRGYKCEGCGKECEGGRFIRLKRCACGGKLVEVSTLLRGGIE